MNLKQKIPFCIVLVQNFDRVSLYLKCLHMYQVLFNKSPHDVHLEKIVLDTMNEIAELICEWTIQYSSPLLGQVSINKQNESSRLHKINTHFEFLCRLFTFIDTVPHGCLK